MKTTRKLQLLVLGASLCLRMDAAFVVNGGFESGFASWTRADQLGSEGTFSLQTGSTSPVTATPVPPPPGGTRAAMTDADGPGSHVLYQTFTVTSAVSAMQLVFDIFVGNRADAFRTPNTLDFATAALNQQARVDILRAGSDPFSVAAADVLLNAFQTTVGSPLVTGYQRVSVNVTAILNANLNTPLILRFAEVDNVNFFQLGVDNVDFVAASAVPEPATYGVALGALAALGVARGRLRR